MTNEEIKNLIDICKQRNELDFLYNMTKIVAESDSIGEMHGYCRNYSRDENGFNNGEMISEGYETPHYDGYLAEAGIYLYETYLKHIGVL